MTVVVVMWPFFILKSTVICKF